MIRPPLICINLTTSIPFSLQLSSALGEQPEAQLPQGMPGASDMENPK